MARKTKTIECAYCANEWQMQKEFKAEIHDQAEKVDPENELDWFALTLGFAIGRGMTIEAAREFALHIRYDTDLG